MLRNDKQQTELLQGTLDLLVLKAVSLRKLHGYGVLLRIEQISGGTPSIEQGALIRRFTDWSGEGLLHTEWEVSENNRRAKYYTLTAARRSWLQQELQSWNRLVQTISAAVAARPQEV